MVRCYVQSLEDWIGATAFARLNLSIGTTKITMKIILQPPAALNVGSYGGYLIF